MNLLPKKLHDHGIFVSEVNPLAIHGHCSRGTVYEVKTDQKDSSLKIVYGTIRRMSIRYNYILDMR